MSPKRAPSRPLYERIRDGLEARIARGDWKEGARLPSENELVEQLGVARMTVHRALRELMQKGLVRRVQGAGTFVAEPAARADLIAIRDIAEDIAARGHRHEAKILKLEAIRADRALADAFEIRSGAPLFHSLIMHASDGAPVQAEERYISPAFAPDYLQQDFTRTTPTSFLQGRGRADEIEQIIRAGHASAALCKVLGVSKTMACIILERRTWHGGAPVTKSIFTSPADRFSYGGRYRAADAPLQHRA